MAQRNTPYSDYYRETHIMQLIDEGRLDWAKVLLESTDSANQPGESGGTPLQVAITRRNIRAVLLLLKFGVNINASYPIRPGCTYRISPLLHALQDKQALLSSLLITQGANITQRDQQGQTPLHHTAKLQSQPVIDLLLQQNPIIDVKDNQNKTPLILSAEIGDILTLKKLLVNGAVADEQDSTGKTALMISAQRGDTEILKTLLQNNVSVDLQDSEGSTAIISAAYKSSPKSHRCKEYLTCIELLIEANANVNLVDDYHNTTLMAACKCTTTNEKAVISLLKAGSDVNASDDLDYTPLHSVLYSGETNIQSILIDHGADVNRETRESDTPLKILASDLQIRETEKECNLIQMLLHAGADPDLKSVMCLAAANYKPQMIQLLLQGGGDINLAHPNYGSVLYNAAYTGYHEMAKIALQYNIRINICKPTSPCVHPEEPDKFALMLTFAAGEKFPFFDVVDFHIPTPI